ncbi:hypothetical protein EYF80_031468 [Liparis tanakae]|uniref:Uncharacterized protein n=1 Tax=Liparis tanakae TaxID=230148 RepID=A0A4Z2GXV3_9TELE|nr:hypothetical protein EYF80_031468 [Liparis tanakae]
MESPWPINSVTFGLMSGQHYLKGQRRERWRNVREQTVDTRRVKGETGSVRPSQSPRTEASGTGLRWSTSHGTTLLLRYRFETDIANLIFMNTMRGSIRHGEGLRICSSMAHLTVACRMLPSYSRELWVPLGVPRERS